MTISRRQLLRGDISGRRTPLRPPGALHELAFVEACTACGGCLEACPEGIIVAAAGGYPALDFSRGECSACGACMAQCPTAALQVARLADGTWRQWAVIGASCVEGAGIACGSCLDVCPVVAISATVPGHRPALDSALCTGCGACYGVCPVRAITLHQQRGSNFPARPNEKASQAEEP